MIVKNFMRTILIVTATLLSAFTLNAQVAVRGTVKSASDGQPVIGAGVLVDGTSTGTITDLDGAWQFNAKEGQVIVVSAIGYATQRFSVQAGKTVYDIVLEDDLLSLEESVVVGYGVQRKKLLTGSTVNVKGSDLAKLSTVSPIGALQSQAPGMQITQNSGQPGQGYKINIRGIGTVGDSEPLVVVDGVAGGSLEALNPSDIESIDVLKDAASAAIYGARAANGVILVTTKNASGAASGSKSFASVSYDMYYGVQNVAKAGNVCNAQEYMQLRDLMNTNSGNSVDNWAELIPADILTSVKNGSWKGTNWLEETTKKNAPVQNHSLNLTYGSDRAHTAMGFSYTAQQGILGYNKIDPVNSDFKRFTFRINSDVVAIRSNDLDILTLGETLNFNQNSNNGIAEGDIYWNSVHDLLACNPLLPVYTYDKDGSISGFYDGEAQTANGFQLNSIAQQDHPLAYDYFRRGRNESGSYSLQGSIYAVLQPIKNLKIRSQFGYRMSASNSRSYTGIYDLGYHENSLESVSQSQSQSHRFTWENTASYHFSENLHTVDAVVGQSIEKWGFGSSLDASSSNLKLGSGNFKYAWLDNTAPQVLSDLSVGGAPHSEGGLASFFGRVNYNFDEKYLFSATVRADGSSNFAKGKRWGVFPSFSAGWVLTNEDFLKNSAWIDFLKLRASWGQNGNCSIDNFQYYSTIRFSDSAGYYFNSKSSLSSGAKGGVLANPDVSWETSQQVDLGFDSRFFDSRLGFTFDWYIKDTKDWLVQAPIAGVFGLGAPYINGGDVRNQGVELVLSWNDHIGDFSYGATLSGSWNKNEVTRLANAQGYIQGEEDCLSENTDPVYRAEVGYPIGYFYGYKTDGVFQNQKQIDEYIAAHGSNMKENPQPGDLIFVDVNGDKTITEADKTMIGNPHPDFNTGLSFYINWKGLDFSVNGYGAFGQEIMKSYRRFSGHPYDNFDRKFFDCWSGEGTSNTLPKFTDMRNDLNWMKISDIYLEKGNYFKVSNITLGYDLKQAWKKLPIAKARFYMSVQNAFTITNYSGMDPEIGYGYEDDWASGIDLGFYPAARTILFGVNLTF